MLKKLGLGFVGLLALALVVAVAGRAAGMAWPGLPLPPVPAALAQAGATRDSTEAAGLVDRRCRFLFNAAQRACYEEALLHMVRQGQIRFAMSTLNVLGQENREIRRLGHDYSHVIGINAWSPGKDLGTIYLQCTELFQSGCYHGVIQAYFAYSGTDSASVARLCSTTPGIVESAWLRFQCVHGIGHGLLQTYTMNLPRALHGCDMLGNSWDAESCYGGAFMEFILGGRGQSHHPHMGMKADSGAASADAEMDHSAMDHGSMDNHPAAADTFPPFKVRNPEDLLYPCSVLGDQYQRACYQMQAGLIVERTGLDFGKVATVCEGAPEPMRSVCYQGIGTYVSGATSRDPEESIRHCSAGSARYRSWCFVGVVKNFVDVTARAEDGMEFCRRLGPVDIATSCYVAVGEEAAVLYRAMDQRESLCRTAESSGYVQACRYGAGLTPERPAELPRP